MGADVRTLVLGALIFFGCSAGSEGSKVSADYDSGSGSPGIDEGEDRDPAEEEEPLAWELSGHLVLATDVIVEADSQLQVRLLGAERALLCEASVQIETATAMDAAQYPESELVGWWRLFVESPSAEGCFGEQFAFPVPVPMLLGVGPLHPEIIAAVGADDSLGTVSTLNSVYASMDGGDTVWVFGVIGTEQAYSGESGPELSAPLSDGAWQFQSVYSFPL
jgi:hypothetical protein